jgi:diguanylate cyclase (GGDEF)-like protein
MIAPVVIRKAKSQADELQQQAMYDGQTQLPNRALMIDRLRQAVLTARHEKRAFGLLRLDVDRFGAINRQFGRAVGDQVLQYVTACIQTCLNEPDTLARMEGDEFAVLSLSVTDLDQTITLAQQIRRSIAQPLEIAGRQLTVTASVGVVMFPHHGDDPETLLSAAGEALRLAQSSRRGLRIYSADMKEGVEDRVALVHELRDAIANNEFTLHYQPKVDIGADRVSGVEALVRWNHPVNGLMAPEQFIPLAEQVDLIKPLTDRVLDAALQQVREWQQAGVSLPVSVKVTAASVEDPAFAKQMAARLERFGVSAANIEIELKEAVDITDPKQTLDCLRQLKEMGFQIAIGDFGANDSSTLFLTEYLVANIKLDRNLVQSMAENKGGIMAVRSAVNLGRTLGINVVAKGVENQDSWNVLRGFGCNAAQGFFMSGPLPPVELVDWLQTSHWAAAAKTA